MMKVISFEFLSVSHKSFTHKNKKFRSFRSKDIRMTMGQTVQFRIINNSQWPLVTGIGRQRRNRTAILQVKSMQAI